MFRMESFESRFVSFTSFYANFWYRLRLSTTALRLRPPVLITNFVATDGFASLWHFRFAALAETPGGIDIVDALV